MCVEKQLTMVGEKQLVQELTHQEKLQERLARLEKWREHKKAADQKAKARKKAPFIVPKVCKASNKTQGEDLNISCVSKASTKNTLPVRKIASDKQWNVTSNESAKKKPENQLLNKPFKPEFITFAPKNFNFSAPEGN